MGTAGSGRRKVLGIDPKNHRRSRIFFLIPPPLASLLTVVRFG